MSAPTGTSNSFRPLHYKSFLGDADPMDMRMRQEEAAAQAEMLRNNPPPPPPPPTYSESELEAARARAFEEGRAAGAREERQTLNQESADREAALINASNKIEQVLIALGVEQQNFLKAQTQVLTRLAMTVAHKVAGRALSQNPLIEIEGMISTALQQLGSKMPLQVFVHPGLVHFMESVYAEKAVYLPSGAMHISFHGDTAITHLDDCRVQWPNGMLSRSQNEIWEQIETILQAFDPVAATAVAPPPEPSVENE
jgi:flagellar assembly protein FliH